MILADPVSKAQRGLTLLETRVRRTALARKWRQRQATAQWQHSSERPTGELAKVAARLRRDGIVLTSMDDIGIERSLQAELCRKGRELADDPEALDRGIDRRDGTTKKKFMYRLLGHATIHDYQPNVFTRMALHANLLSVVNEYFGCYSWLMRYNVWLNVPSDSSPQTSQLWHRDCPPTGLQPCLKMFITLEDVGPENGPFFYAPGTHFYGRHSTLEAPCIYEDDGVPRTLDEQMEQVVPRNEWVECLGRAGTVILTDTSGYHKGGWVREGRRLLFKTQFGEWTNDHGCMVRFHDFARHCVTDSARWATRET